MRFLGLVPLVVVVASGCKVESHPSPSRPISSREILDWVKGNYVPRLARELSGSPRLTIVAADGQQLLVDSVQDGGPLVATMLLSVVETQEQFVRVQVRFINKDGEQSAGPLLSLVRTVVGLDEFDRHAQ